MMGTNLTLKLSLWPSKTSRQFSWRDPLGSLQMIFYVTTSPLIIISHIKWCFISMCLLFQWFLGSLDYATTPLLSQNSIKGDTAKGTIPNPIKNFWSQITYFTVLEVTTYLTSIMKSTIQDCITLLQLTTPPPRVNTNSEVNLWESLSD